MAIAPPARVPTDAPIARAITPDIFRASTSPCVPEFVRPHVRGKFLFAGDEKFYVRGVSYGAFQPDASGHEYHDPNVIERDFAQMAANGINTVRIPHTMPPRSLLGAAQADICSAATNSASCRTTIRRPSGRHAISSRVPCSARSAK